MMCEVPPRSVAGAGAGVLWRGAVWRQWGGSAHVRRARLGAAGPHSGARARRGRCGAALGAPSGLVEKARAAPWELGLE